MHNSSKLILGLCVLISVFDRFWTHLQLFWRTNEVLSYIIVCHCFKHFDNCNSVSENVPREEKQTQALGRLILLFLFYHLKSERWNVTWYIREVLMAVFIAHNWCTREYACNPGCAVPPFITDLPEPCVPGRATSRYISKVVSGFSLEERKTVGQHVLCMLGTIQTKSTYKNYNWCATETVLNHSE